MIVHKLFNMWIVLKCSLLDKPRSALIAYNIYWGATRPYLVCSSVCCWIHFLLSYVPCLTISFFTILCSATVCRNIKTEGGLGLLVNIVKDRDTPVELLEKVLAFNMTFFTHKNNIVMARVLT